MIKYNILVCRYDKMLVNVAAYEMRPHLPTFYHNDTLVYCILSF